MSNVTQSPGSNLALRGEGIGKWYRLGEYAGGGELLRERIERLVRGRAFSGGAGNSAKEGMWALRDVSFDIERGESVALVGRNGAGKSTLLKLLARITLPTEGRALVWGKAASLLEVGTGFQIDLTGRDNVYLNGAILGMSRREIDRKFDDIVEFSGVERFLDTPVKRYSSGMQVRLAFAVAAHLESDVLLVDEVLAVGDLEFQRKCLGKMRSVASEGRTVLFVSHNMQAVHRLCPRALLIDSGHVVMDGPTEQVAAEYRRRVDPQQSGGISDISEGVPRMGTGEARLRRVVMRNLEGEITNSFAIGQPFRVALTFEVSEPVQGADVEIGISTPEGERFATAETIDEGYDEVDFPAGLQEITAEIALTMLPRDYVLDVGFHRIRGTSMIDWVERVLSFTVLNVATPGARQFHWAQPRGYVRPATRWSTVSAVTSSPSGSLRGSAVQVLDA